MRYRVQKIWFNESMYHYIKVLSRLNKKSFSKFVTSLVDSYMLLMPLLEVYGSKLKELKK